MLSSGAILARRFALTVVSAMACTIAVIAPSHATVLIDLSGSVVTAEGDPVAGIPMLWAGATGGSAQTTSAADGSFTFSNVQSGVANIYVGSLAPSPGSGQYPGGFRADSRVSYDSDTSGLTLTLPALDTVPVTVESTDGSPVAGARVDSTYTYVDSDSFQIRCPSDYQLIAGQLSSCAQFLGSNYESATTDANGNATLRFVDNPTFTATTIAATDPVNPARTARTQPFTAHDTPPVTITLPDLISLSGSVVTAEGDPVAGIPMLWAGATGGSAQTTSAADGSFTFSNVQSGVANIYVGSLAPSPGSGQYPGGFRADSRVSYDSDTSGLTLTLPALDTVPVTVESTDGSPVAGARVDSTYTYVDSDSFQIRCPSDYQLIAGQLSSCAQFLGSNYESATTDANGNATLRFVDNPTFTATTIAATDPVNPARTARTQPFTAHDTPPVTITLPDLISLSGSVVTAEGDPVAGIPMLWAGATGGSAQTTSAADGSFTFSNVQSGVANIYVGSLAPSPGSGQYPGGFRADSRVSYDSDTSGLTLTLPALDTVPVTVESTDGSPVAGARVDSTYTYVDSDSFQIRCPSDYQLIAGQLSSCAQFLGSNYESATTDANGNATLRFVDNPTFTATTIAATDPVNPARTARTQPFTAHDTPPVTITLPDRPGAPQNPDGTPTDSTITATWDAPSTDGGSAITGYTVSATAGSAPANAARADVVTPSVQISVGPNTHQTSLRNLKPGTPYTISVRATNAIGTGPAAQTIVTTTGTAKPVVTGVSPAQGRLAGGQMITLTGSGFVAGATVNLVPPSGGTAIVATNVRIVSSTMMTVKTPTATAAGKYGVMVTTAGGTSSVVTASHFTYDAKPVVTGVSPAHGSIAGGTRITISGSGFVTGATVRVGTISATNVRVVNATTIQATSAAATKAGKYPVVVTTPGGTSTASAMFQYAVSPTVTAISPAAGPAAGGTRITITGTGFTANAAVTIGTTSATNVRFVNATTILATTAPSVKGGFAVTVTTIGGTSLRTTAGRFTYV